MKYGSGSQWTRRIPVSPIRKNQIQLAVLLGIITVYYLVFHGLTQLAVLPNPFLTQFWAEDGWVQITYPMVHPMVLPAGTNGGDQLYGQILEVHLPWYDDPPVHLVELRQQYEAYLMVSAFRTTLPNPMYQEEDNVSVAAQYLAGTVILPGETFSLNRAIGPRTKARGFGYGPIYVNGHIDSAIGGGICKVATTMYNAVILADLQVIERHSHSMPVPYVPPGRDATIVWGAKDLRFKNNKKEAIVIWSETQNNTLFIALYGQYDPPLVEWHSEELSCNQTWTIKRRNSHPATGEVRLIEGCDGISVRTWVEIHYPDQPTQRRDQVSTTTIPCLVLWSLVLDKRTTR